MSDTSQEQNAPENDAWIPPAAIRCISGLIYQVLRPGTGNERPGPDDVVQVVYRARTETGRLFDTSGDNNTPKTLSMRGVIPGVAEALNNDYGPKECVSGYRRTSALTNCGKRKMGL